MKRLLTAVYILGGLALLFTGFAFFMAYSGGCHVEPTPEKTLSNREVVVYLIHAYPASISVIRGEAERDEIADSFPVIADKLGRGKDLEALLEAGWRVWGADYSNNRKLDYVEMRAPK